MSDITPAERGFQIDAEIIAQGFGLTAADVAQRMRDGRITSRCEQGVAEDLGRWRLTFYCDGRALRLTLGPDLQILSRASFDMPRPRSH